MWVVQAERLREILTRLGPAFVKIGQVMTSFDYLLETPSQNASVDMLCMMILLSVDPVVKGSV